MSNLYVVIDDLNFEVVLKTTDKSKAYAKAQNIEGIVKLKNEVIADFTY